MRKPLFLLFILLLPLSSEASVARRAGLPDLVGSSSTVVVGTVTQRSSFWSGTRIYTRNQITVEEIWLQGTTVDPTKLTLPSSSPILDVHTLGGVVGDIGQSVSGSPRLVTGHTYVLFLTEGAPHQWHVVGMAQGAFEASAEVLRPLTQAHALKLIGDTTVIPTTRTKLRQAIIQWVRSQP
jgi:hypothetical protein